MPSKSADGSHGAMPGDTAHLPPVLALMQMIIACTGIQIIDQQGAIADCTDIARHSNGNVTWIIHRIGYVQFESKFPAR
jgi:hypothetical protein